MDLGLIGRRALVTGASRGIGLAVVRGLVAEGATVVAGARTRGDELAALVEGGQVEAVQVDLASPDGPAELVAAARHGGPIDILVNNAGGVTPRLDGFAAVTDADWEATWTLTLMAAVRTTRAVIGDMVAAGRGTIVTTSSVNAFLPDPAVIDYSAAKAALTNFSKALSKEVGPAGVRVNTVSPGPVSTALWLGDGGVADTIAGTVGGEPGDVARQAVAGTATGRFTTPEEVADLVVMLCGERARNVTGADFVIDGGLIQTL
jgi:NAD(P)-dependent dehydrogenase (short-subunit alcohol dehydrogenase family)